MKIAGEKQGYYWGVYFNIGNAYLAAKTEVDNQAFDRDVMIEHLKKLRLLADKMIGELQAEE